MKLFKYKTWVEHSVFKNKEVEICEIDYLIYEVFGGLIGKRYISNGKREIHIYPKKHLGKKLYNYWNVQQNEIHNQ